MTAEEQEHYDERVAIMVVEAGLPRQEAEAKAWADVMRARKAKGGEKCANLNH